jgi:hypothetical protein
MSEDTRDWLAQTESLMRLRGEEPTEDAMVGHFAMHGRDKRIAIQHAMDGESQGEIEYNDADLRRASERTILRRRFRDVHNQLLKAGR